jgi:hypothetical protein
MLNINPTSGYRSEQMNPAIAIPLVFCEEELSSVLLLGAVFE